MVWDSNTSLAAPSWIPSVPAPTFTTIWPLLVVKLTEAGERYFEMISEKVEQIVEATDRLRGHQAVAVLTVRATPSLSTKWLLPRLTALSHQDRSPRFGAARALSSVATLPRDGASRISPNHPSSLPRRGRAFQQRADHPVSASE